jgi:hypothetical protein
MSTITDTDRHQVDKWQRLALIAGVVALLPCCIATIWPVEREQFFRVYLVNFQFVADFALGSLALFMIYWLTSGAWGWFLRRFVEAGMRTLPLVAILFTPVAVGIGILYPWANPDLAKLSPQVKWASIYLNPTFFYWRAALYFILWMGLALLLTRWSREQDETSNPRIPRRCRLLCAPALVFYGVFITFASVDWSMSLQPSFHSTMFGPLYAVNQILPSMALAVIMLCILSSRPPFRNLISIEALTDMGSLLFAFLIIWAYMNYFQFMLIWIANLPDEAIYFLPRATAGWQYVIWAIFILGFVVPFFMLLSRDIKRNPRLLTIPAGLILFMNLVVRYWETEPPFQCQKDYYFAASMADHWMDFLMPIGLGGIWFAFYLYQLKRFPLVALHDFNQHHVGHLRYRDEEEVMREEALAGVRTQEEIHG